MEGVLLQCSSALRCPTAAAMARGARAVEGDICSNSLGQGFTSSATLIHVWGASGAPTLWHITSLVRRGGGAVAVPCRQVGVGPWLADSSLAPSCLYPLELDHLVHHQDTLAQDLGLCALIRHHAAVRNYISPVPSELRRSPARRRRRWGSVRPSASSALDCRQ